MASFEWKALPFDDVRVGTGLSLLELELWESDRAFSPFVDGEDPLLIDPRFRLSPGISKAVGSLRLQIQSENQARW